MKKIHAIQVLLLLTAVLIILNACNSEIDRQADLDRLMKTDREFNDLSQKEGVKKAFLEFADENSLMLPNFNQPVYGRDALSEFLSTENDEGRLVWSPESGEVSSSGDLGYTWGRYTFTFIDSGTTEGSSHGKYVTIWKKQKDGSWKWLIDIGNQNLEP